MLFVRCVLWFGIILDFLNVLQYCFPSSATSVLGITVAMTPLLRFTLIHAATLMAAWTLLLIWADRKPLERRGVMLLTIPITLGIEGSLIYLIAADTLPASRMAILLAPLVTAGLFLAAYLTARRMATERIQ